MFFLEGIFGRLYFRSLIFTIVRVGVAATHNLIGYWVIVWPFDTNTNNTGPSPDLRCCTKILSSNVSSWDSSSLQLLLFSQPLITMFMSWLIMELSWLKERFCAVHFLTCVTSRVGQIMQTWGSCKPQTTLPTRTHWSMTITSWKMAAHEGAFMSLFTRQSGGQRVLPSQDSEDAQQQFSRAHPCSIKVFLPSFYPWCHSCEKMYQALSRFTVLQVTGSWARAWEWGWEWVHFWEARGR